MAIRNWRAMRAAGGILAFGLAAAGLVFALRGGDAPRSEPPAVGEKPTVAVTRAVAQPAESVAPAPTTTEPASAGSSPVSPGAEPTAAPGITTMVPVSAPIATAAAAATSLPDIPKYTDVAVLALAADALVPSGKTFRECVESPHEKWPVPVHLYYEGKGRWLVETHVSEVQVVFDEATATFTPRNFAPLNPDCR